MKILFIGNSHTYFNDMPYLFREICAYNQIDTDITMLAHGGMGLDFHAEQPEVRFNLLYGNYDYVVLQHVAHPFGDKEILFTAARKLAGILAQTASKAVLYMTWSEKCNPQGQAHMADCYLRLGKELQIPVAPVGLAWQRVRTAFPELELYYNDGEHASLEGSTLAAYTIAVTIFGKELKARTPAEEFLLTQAVEAYTSLSFCN